MPPRVSIVIPTYGRPAQLAECLGAIAAQEYTDYECIVVNDGGPPVEPVLERVGLAVRLINLPANVGHAAARNRGVQEASGEFVALCDDDDLWLPGHLARLVAAADAGGRDPRGAAAAGDGAIPGDGQTPGGGAAAGGAGTGSGAAPGAADVVYSDAEIVVMRPGPGGRVPVRRALFAFDFDPDLLRRWNIVTASAALYRRSLHLELGPFDEAMQHYWDWDWWLRASRFHTVVRVPVASVLVTVDASGQNASAVPDRMAPYLGRLIRKHGLDPVPTSNFLRMLSEPELQPALRPSERVWDGTSLPGRPSRLQE